MPKHPDYVKIFNRFIKQYGKKKGEELYYAWINSKKLDDTKPFPKKREKKEMMCSVIGLEIKEIEGCFHVEGLIATSHIDKLDLMDGVEIPDRIPRETLESFANQINTTKEARIMGIHHSEGHPFNPEYFGEADVENHPARVIPLKDGEWGLFVDTKLIPDDPETPKIIERFQSGDLNSFSITYDTDGFMTTDFEWVDDQLVRVLNPDTRLAGYTGASNPVNPQAVAVGYGFKEFKELVEKEVINKKEVEKKMPEKEVKEDTDSQGTEVQPSPDGDESKPEEGGESQPSKEQPDGGSEGEEGEDAEKKEFQKWKSEKKVLEAKELLEKTADRLADKVVGKIEMKEKVLKDNNSSKPKEVSLEVKEFMDVINNPGKLELKEQFRRAAAVCEAINLDWQTARTSPAESREFKNFGVNGTKLEFKGLGVTTNQNTDTDYLQSTAELQDVYDPIIYNAINQATVAWNLLAKDDFSGKGNNQVQFTLKTAANASAAFYTGNSVATDNVTRLKYQTKFKKLQVGVSVDERPYCAIMKNEQNVATYCRIVSNCQHLCLKFIRHIMSEPINTLPYFGPSSL